MSVEQKLTDKNIVTTTTTTNNTTSSSNSNSNSKPSNNKKNNHNSAKKIIKKALKTSKSKKTNKTTIANVNNNNSNSGGSNNNTDISNKIAKSNNNNKSKNTNNEVDCGGISSTNNNNNNIEVPNDEIIEELFDFSDSDLKELDASNEENIKGNNNNDVISDISGEPGEQTEVVEMQKIIVNDNNNNKEQQQQHQQVLSNESTDNIDKQTKEKEKNTEEENEIKTTNALEESPSTLNIVSNGGNETVKEHNKDPVQQTAEEKKSPKENDTIQQTNNVLNTHCSVEADDKTLASPSSSPALPDIKSMQTINESSGPEFISVSNESSHTATTADKNNADSDLLPEDGDGDDDDAGEYVEPYDELLVQFLDEANQIAEARLAARRHARAEAREIRMRELERQQKEQESNADRVFDMHTNSPGITSLSHMRLGLGSSPVTGLLNSTRGNSMSSRRSSEDSLEEEGRSLRDIRHELKDVEDRFRKAMIANAQLDNDRASQTYQIQLLKDKLEDMEESYAQLQRECKEKSRDCNALKRSLDKLSEELKLVQGQLDERDTLITEQGLVIVAIENEDGTDAKRALVSVENAQLLGSVQGSLDVRLKKFSEEKQQLQSEVQHLQEQLEIYKSQGKGRGKNSSSNGPLGSDDDDYEAQREANKIISDYKYKLQKAEQEIASLQSSLARSETQVIRYKSTAEAAEKAEAELKIERRKLQRENREAMEKLEELETSNNHLLKRLDKLKNAKSALLKDL